jgi:hypothetical protein
MVRPWSMLFWMALVATSAVCCVVFLLVDSKTNNTNADAMNFPLVPEWPLIHIVNTRFMQEQANLTALSMARLYLFRTFCLPTMIHQTTTNFLWIIKTDPKLSLPIRQELVRLLKPYPNFYLVGSNVNFLVPDNRGAWRDGAEGRHLLEEAVLYTGNRTMLKQAQLWQPHVPVLETRLDADDGLHVRYLEYVQETALEMLEPPPPISPSSPTLQNEEQPSSSAGINNLQWLYWCTRRHIEWHAADDDTPNVTAPADGWFNPMEHSKLCITPGITIGFAVGVNAADVPIYDHDKIYKEIVQRGGCHKGSSMATPGNRVDDEKKRLQCLHWVDDALMFAAIRSRTLTSAGMRHVASSSEDNTTATKPFLPPQLVEHMWRYMETNFFVARPEVEQTQRYLQQHVIEIAQDNLRGQCTSGHSCKVSKLLMIRMANNLIILFVSDQYSIAIIRTSSWLVSVRVASGQRRVATVDTDEAAATKATSR